MAGKIELLGNFDELKLIAAVDTAYGKNAGTVYASVVLMSFPEIQEIERVFQYDQVTFPYIPGLFFYREGPTILKALSKLESEPDVVIVHGHGIAHPRRCGIASQVGVVLSKPTIGCARRMLCGYHRPVAPSKGSFQPMTLKSKEIGLVYRSKENVKPIFISPGHMCNLQQARDIVVRSLRGYRLPEPLRLAHLFANKFRRRIESKKDSQHSSNGKIV
ncbi:MAG: endonuclease V [Candidatus Zixiibacteriota bacterium]|nr:MAG: endonuclease V [candidate division Zixibacteria bacterium]